MLSGFGGSDGREEEATGDAIGGDGCIGARGTGGGGREGASG